ncbi:unnamed protein product [Moneuplotes crassus]|uniref:CHAT domain-containing protein n=1 Tax=Euplotes crassus TaxID=5936 RepID=A0AAD2CZY3_EUPCR|nr:unnamed protein product [Moneuplotes crassus]
MQNLANVLVVKPKILHFSGHGKRGAGEGENDFLVLEKENFENDNLTGKMIKELFAQNKEKDDMIKVAVVLSCESQKVGEVFENAGIGHVICIRRECEVDDHACLEFVKTFYNSLLIGKKCSVCEAFEQAKAAVKHKMKATEANKFLCLSDHRNKVNQCRTVFQLDLGDSHNLSVKPKIEALPNRERTLIGREQIIVRVMKEFENNQRCVWFTGDHGIGKSAIAKEIAHLFYDRNYCRDGVLYLALKEVDNIESYIDTLFKTMKHSLKDLKMINDLNSYTNASPETIYHACLSSISNFEVLVILDDCASLMASVGLKIIDDFSKKVQNSKIILTSKIKEKMSLSRDGRLELLYSKEISIGKLPDYCIYCLIQPVKKDRLTFERECRELCKTTSHVDEKNKCKNFLEHKLIKLLKGNPLCALLVSSNADDTSISEIYRQVEKSAMNKKDINLVMAWNISLKYISDKSTAILECLNHLSLCPDGLGNTDLIQISPKWNEKWINILKKKSMITEKEIYEEEYTMKKDLSRSRSKRKSKSIRKSRVDNDVLEIVYKMEPKFREYVAATLTPKSSKKYDENIVKFMNSKMEELLHASNREIGLLEIYEENLWEILERLRKEVAKKGGIQLLNHSITKDQKKINEKQFCRQISRLNTFAGEKRKKPKADISITKLFAMKKFKMMEEPTLEELCFTGKYENTDTEPQDSKIGMDKNNSSQRGIGGSLFCSGIINSPRSRMQQSQKITKFMVNKIIGLNMEKIEEEKDHLGDSTPKPANLSKWKSTGDNIPKLIFPNKQSSGPPLYPQDPKNKRIEASFQGLDQNNKIEEEKELQSFEYSSSDQLEGGSEEAEGEEDFSSFGERTCNSRQDNKEEDNHMAMSPVNHENFNRASKRYIETGKRTDAKYLDQAKSVMKSENTDNCDNTKMKQKALKKTPLDTLNEEQHSEVSRDDRSMETDSDLKSMEEKEQFLKKYDRNASLISNKDTLGRISTHNEKAKSTLSNKRISREAKELKIHDKFVILFATLLLRSERINDSFDVCNIYGRKLLQDNELTRANIYKILALTCLETGTDGSTPKALKHCDKAMQKFKNIQCLEGKVCCMLIKILIMQLLKYDNDSDYSDEENSFDSDENNTDTAISKRIAKLISETTSILPTLNTYFSEYHCERISEELNKSEEEKRPYHLTSIPSLQKFVRNPILKYKCQEVHSKPSKPSKPIRNNTKKSGGFISDEKIDYLLNNIGSKFDHVFQKLDTALFRLDKVETTVMRDTKEYPTFEAPPHPHHNTQKMIQAFPLNQGKRNEKRERNDRRKSGSQSRMQKNSGIPKEKISEQYRINIEVPQKAKKQRRQSINLNTSNQQQYFNSNKNFEARNKGNSSKRRNSERQYNPSKFSAVNTNSKIIEKSDSVKNTKRRARKSQRASIEPLQSDTLLQTSKPHKQSSQWRKSRKISQEKERLYSSLSTNLAKHPTLKQPSLQLPYSFTLPPPGTTHPTPKSTYCSKPGFSYTSQYTCPTFTNLNRSGLSKFYSQK